MSVKHWSAFLCMAAVLTAIMILIFPGQSQGAELIVLPDGSKLDLSQKCPVCGMEIGKEGQGVTITFNEGRVVGFHGVAAAVFHDGHVVGFEGARCLFIYNSIPEKYNANVADIAHQYVTDFFSKKMIDLPRAFLVLGSNVKGPMGYDLIPFTDLEKAAKFASKNDGKWIVQLHEITRAVKEMGKTQTGPLSSSPGVDERRLPALVPEPTPVAGPKPIPEKAQRRVVPQSHGGFDPYEPSVGGYGHHGGSGHHGH